MNLFIAIILFISLRAMGGQAQSDISITGGAGVNQMINMPIRVFRQGALPKTGSHDYLDYMDQVPSIYATGGPGANQKSIVNVYVCNQEQNTQIHRQTEIVANGRVVEEAPRITFLGGPGANQQASLNVHLCDSRGCGCSNERRRAISGQSISVVGGANANVSKNLPMMNYMYQFPSIHVTGGAGAGQKSTITIYICNQGKNARTYHTMGNGESDIILLGGPGANQQSNINVYLCDTETCGCFNDNRNRS